jgi:hypothetical protein
MKLLHRCSSPKRFTAVASRLLCITFCTAAFAARAFAGATARPRVSDKILRATSVYVDCVCPRGLAVARPTAVQELQGWGHFQLVDNYHQADLVFLFSGNPYLGDYLTRDGPDKRYVAIVSTIMTVIDAKTGESLWTDSRRWGSWRVRGATKDLIGELRQQMEQDTTKSTLNDILACSVTPAYADFAQLSPEDALARSGGKVFGTPERLTLSSPAAPNFCKRAEFVFGPDHRIVGYAVTASREDGMDVNEVLTHAERFDFTSGRYSSGQAYFSAQSKDGRLIVLFSVDGHRLLLARVSFFY